MQLGNDNSEQISHRYADDMPCMKSISSSMYKLLTKQMSAADADVAADNKPNAIPLQLQGGLKNSLFL